MKIRWDAVILFVVFLSAILAFMWIVDAVELSKLDTALSGLESKWSDSFPAWQKQRSSFSQEFLDELTVFLAEIRELDKRLGFDDRFFKSAKAEALQTRIHKLGFEVTNLRKEQEVRRQEQDAPPSRIRNTPEPSSGNAGKD